MCKKALLVIILAISAGYVQAQYEDDAPGQRFDTQSVKKTPFFKAPGSDNFIKGTEFMFSLTNGFVFGEISPFAGFKIAKPLMIGAGINGAFYVGNGQGNSGFTYGAHGFLRLNLGEVAFLHAEMRGINALLPGSGVLSSSERKWVASPILGLGMAQSAGMGSWFLIGYAPNTEYASTQPLGSIVYRIGITF
ncbi:MAG: hypothetical protein ACK5FT_09555 [Sphingomonadales bacterium]|jgi:hypothetical protein